MRTLTTRSVTWIFTTLLLPFAASPTLPAQEPEIVRPGPPSADDLEKDINGDGVPDGWYNSRDAIWESKGGIVGPHYVRFESTRRGRPSTLSRAFGVDGRKTEAIILGFWIKLNNIQFGERVGQEPSLMIDFLGEGLTTLSRGIMGPWTESVGSRWTRVAKRIPVPPGARDAIMSLGLLGAKGLMDFDGLTIDLVPRDEAPTTNLVVNGDFELGDPDPAYWVVNNEAHRVFPGHDSRSAVELTRSGSRILTGIAMPVDGLGSIAVSLYAEGKSLRGGGGAAAAFYFLDDNGEPVPGSETGVYALAWGGSFGWRRETAQVRVPPGSRRAVIQFEKTDNLGSIRLDDIQVVAAPNAEIASWVPFHAGDDTEDWLKVPTSPRIAPNSALDFSFLVPGPAGRKGFVGVKEGKLVFEKGGRARFHGVTLLPPTAFLETERADELADRLARSGINLVRIGDLDTPLGPDRSLLDDTRDDTKAFDPEALRRLGHLIAALKAKGISVALELQSNRRYRDGDGVALAGLLPPGGGPAALFDPTLTKLAQETAIGLLEHKNPETGLALRDDPALAWVTLLGEVSLFNQLEDPDNALPGEYAQALRTLGQRIPNLTGTGRRFWQAVETAHYKAMAESLRKAKLRVPIAGSAHWRREAEFATAQGAPGLELVDDRLFWMPPLFLSPERRSQLWSQEGSLSSGAHRKRQQGLAYAVGQWCPQTQGAWALPLEAGDTLLAAATAVHEDWDALVRRGIFLFPLEWGEGPAGTVGGEDIFQLREVVNGTPQVYALWPHVSSIVLRGQLSRTAQEAEKARGAAPRRRARPGEVAGWDPSRGRLVVHTPFTQGLAGWFAGETATFPDLDISSENPFAVVVASAVGPEPISTTKRLLVTAIGRVEPTGFRWVDRFQGDVADPGRPPFLQEPVSARVAWRRKGKIRAYVLDNSGERIREVKAEPIAGGEGVVLTIDAKVPAFHWELVTD